MHLISMRGYYEQPARLDAGRLHSHRTWHGGLEGSSHTCAATLEMDGPTRGYRNSFLQQLPILLSFGKAGRYTQCSRF